MLYVLIDNTSIPYLAVNLRMPWRWRTNTCISYWELMVCLWFCYWWFKL